MTAYLVPAGAILIFIVIRVLSGRRGLAAHLVALEAEGILRRERRVLTSARFPVIKRVGYNDLYLTRRRFEARRIFSGRRLLQAPLGAPGIVGSDRHGFEVERDGERVFLTLRTALRGGGRIRFRVADPEAWLADIRAHGDE